MENMFLGNGRRYPQRPTHHPFSQSPSFGGGVPVYRFDPAREPPRTGRPERNHASKVVQIPVHFVGSEQPDRPGSAVKVQKVFRGFLVRKFLKKIKDVKVRVDEIEERLSNGEVVELVRRDPKERVRMSEELMSLLLKLDSISGVDFGVKACRKAVIRKAIALQERIDAIVAGEIEIEVVSNRPSENEENPAEFADVGVDREVKATSEENCVAGDEKESERNRELLEKIMEENEKMTRMMTKIFEKNESQSRMIDALTSRVGMLEKAFVCDGRLRKKKTKKNKRFVCN